VIPVITPQESARLDAAASDSVDVLMDRAGYGLALAIARQGVGYGDRVVVLAGPGNNGGDGYVAARYLHRRGVWVEVHALSAPKTDVSKRARRAALASGVRVVEMGEPVRADLVVDAVFGGGFRSGVPDALDPWLATDLPVVAVDVPTGLDPTSGTVDEAAFTAALTVTFHAVKTGHLRAEGPDRCGPIEIVDIGLDGGEPTFRIAEDGDALRPERPRTAHKWSAGSVLVVGGATGMTGAAVMAGRAALRFGAGAVAVAVPQDARTAVTSAAPELLTVDITAAVERASRFDVVVVGPGLGPGRQELVDRLLERHEGLVVLDADALTAETADRMRERRHPTLVTPHAGEFARTFGRTAGPDSAADVAAGLGITVLLKGNPTWITDGDAPWAVVSNGPELATIGTGDVLAGMVAALSARGLAPVEAAISGAHWHGVAGEQVRRTGTVTADRLLGEIPRHAWEDE
jgi:hydroxyethylthiazole kinase-like uncharacterized protein yjeF